MPKKPVSALLFLVLLGLASACSGPGEDVRVKTCKHLAAHLSKAAGDLDWQAHRQEIRDPEYAVIKVRSSAVRADCWYEYDAAEETYETHVDPLSAYATVPYRMSLNGRVVAAPALYHAMSELRLEAGKRLIEQARQMSESIGNGG